MLRSALRIFCLFGALALAACSSPTSRSISGDGMADGADPSASEQARIDAIALAQGGIPREETTLAYVYHRPGLILAGGETISLDGGPRLPVRNGSYLVWELTTDTNHLLEAWRGTRRLAAQSIVLREGDVAYFLFAEKANAGGIRYFPKVSTPQGRALIRDANFGGQ